jgi:hypothetical protein
MRVHGGVWALSAFHPTRGHRLENIDDDLAHMWERLCVKESRDPVYVGVADDFPRHSDTKLSETAEASLRAHLRKEYHALNVRVRPDPWGGEPLGCAPGPYAPGPSGPCCSRATRWHPRCGARFAAVCAHAPPRVKPPQGKPPRVLLTCALERVRGSHSSRSPLFPRSMR